MPIAQLRIGAAVALPLVKGGELVAMLVAHNASPREWSEREVGMLEEAAERTWAAVERARAIVAAGIPVMGHVGLTPQTATALGGYRSQGRTAERGLEVMHDAIGLEEAGCFALVLEAVPFDLCTLVEEVLDQMAEAGIENVLALRGDPPKGQTEWTATAGGLEFSRELIELIRDEYDFAIGAACFPEVHIHATDAESDLRYLKEKVDAGARFLITQMFFDNQFYYDFVARAREIGIDVPIIPGIWPITNASQIKRVTEMCGSRIPEALLRELEERAPFEFKVRDMRSDGVVLDLDDDAAEAA